MTIKDLLAQTQEEPLLKGFLDNWRVGSIQATRSRCVEKICAELQSTGDIIELGAGDGVFTKLLVNRLGQQARITAIENNHFLANQLRNNLKDSRLSIIEKDALQYMKIAAFSNPNSASYIISGIPLSFLNSSERVDFIKNCQRCLKPGGKFILYQSIFTIYNLREIIKHSGCSLKSLGLRVFWKNLPPLWVINLNADCDIDCSKLSN